MLDTSLIEQLRGIFSELGNDYLFDVSVRENHPNRVQLLELLNDVVSVSDRLSLKENPGDGLLFDILKNGAKTGVRFRAVPTGHEFTSLLLAVLNADGRGKNLPDEFVTKRVRSLKGDIRLTTYMSLTCTNCPDVVQALNAMAVINPRITHEAVDGAIYKEEADALDLQGVPAVFADGELLHVGRANFGELLSKLEAHYGVETSETEEQTVRDYDVIVVGGGPAGVAAAIYSARKGLNVAVVAERVGGQVNETGGIENLISVPNTTGGKLADDLKNHMGEYPIDIFEHRSVENVKMENTRKIVLTQAGEIFTAPALIIATGASWRKLNVPGETEFIGRGVAFCPHCDGPFYKGKRVAVIGGGNSGIEAAIDLAGICSHVTVFEFLEELKADKVLQEKVKSLSNVEIFLHSQTTEVINNGEKVVGLKVKDRKTEEERVIDLDGVFVQIGLAPNSAAFKDVVRTNRFGEIEIDERARTDVPGIYAAGDVTTVPYKQIIISMGEGAKAALTAFDDRIRGI
ncbi:alkyl hydroperoxide reductase subunit F [Proteiniphilum sp. X52]|uniref:alkyl hydroperoxide reductase subunit F n=1 Tax=Proteiniphilum sp. X52 TaxID=2382159 RepID=UPI000F0A0549|nr:alkyl hydroperoxide reductase subunit F [Proteiniphilum sp. X52]RNC63923.1 alkyl hydroperoxide reductase subunit F [Proteiniphilum sp. X52]